MINQKFDTRCAQVAVDCQPCTQCSYLHPQQVGGLGGPSRQQGLGECLSIYEGMKVRLHWPENSPKKTSLNYLNPAR